LRLALAACGLLAICSVYLYLDYNTSNVQSYLTLPYHTGQGAQTHLKVKVKEVDLYSAFIEVPYTQGAQVRITQ